MTGTESSEIRGSKAMVALKAKIEESELNMGVHWELEERCEETCDMARAARELDDVGTES